MSDIPSEPVDPVVIPGQDPPELDPPAELPQSPEIEPDPAPAEMPDEPEQSTID
jgi:hypothetical protein